MGNNLGSPTVPRGHYSRRADATGASTGGLAERIAGFSEAADVLHTLAHAYATFVGATLLLLSSLIAGLRVLGVI